MKIEFCHLDRNTIAAELPSAINLVNYLNQHMRNEERPKLIIPTGVANLHPNDEYTKATGREVSKSKLKNVDYKLRNFYFDSEKNSYRMEFEGGGLLLVLSMRDDKRQVRLMGADLW